MERWIAYIDDSEMNLEALEHCFSQEFKVDTFVQSEAFLKSFPQRHYDAILVDLHMPKMNGFETFEAIIQHSDYNGCPVIIISSDDSVASRVRSFELGAVDFISRSSSIEEMLAQINSKIQYFKQHRTIINFGNLKIDQTQLKVYLNKEEVFVTFTEMKMLSLLLRSSPEGVSKEKLIEYIWGDSVVMDNTIYTHIFNLNSKLESWLYDIRISKVSGLIEVVEKRLR